MGRPATFNRDELINRAMYLFWQKGYESLTLQNLLDAFQINNSSFYNAFRSKEALFDEVLEYYYRNIGVYRVEPLLKDGLVADRLHDFFSRLMDTSAGESNPHGCFVNNSTVLSASATPSVAAKVQQVVHATQDRLERSFLTLFERGRATGELSEAIDPVQHSRLFVAIVFGLNSMARMAKNRKQLEDVAIAALQTCFPGRRFQWDKQNLSVAAASNF